MCNEPIEDGIVEGKDPSDTGTSNVELITAMDTPKVPVDNDQDTLEVSETSGPDQILVSAEMGASEILAETQVLPPAGPQWKMVPLTDTLAEQEKELAESLNWQVRIIMQQTRSITELRRLLPTLALPEEAWVTSNAYSFGANLRLPWDPGYIGEMEKTILEAGFTKVSELQPTESEPRLLINFTYGEFALSLTFSAQHDGSTCELVETDETVTVEKTIKKYKIVCK